MRVKKFAVSFKKSYENVRWNHGFPLFFVIIHVLDTVFPFVQHSRKEPTNFHCLLSNQEYFRALMQDDTMSI